MDGLMDGWSRARVAFDRFGMLVFRRSWRSGDARANVLSLGTTDIVTSVVLVHPFRRSRWPHALCHLSFLLMHFLRDNVHCCVLLCHAYSNKCYRCSEKGHIERDCPQRAAGGSSKDKR
jgi:hypothetical protein